MNKIIKNFVIAAALIFLFTFIPLKFGIMRWAYAAVISSAAHQEVSIKAIEAYPLRKAVFKDMDISIGKKMGLNISRATLDYNLVNLLGLKLPVKLHGENLTLYNKVGAVPSGNAPLKINYMAFSSVDASLVLKPGEVIINKASALGNDAKAVGSGVIKRKEMNVAFDVKLNPAGPGMANVPGVGKLFKFIGVDETIPNPSFDFTAVVTGNPKDPSFDISSDILKLKFDKR